MVRFEVLPRQYYIQHYVPGHLHSAPVQCQNNLITKQIDAEDLYTMIRRFALVATAGILFSIPGMAALIGLSDGSPGTLYSIDPGTGAATPIVTMSGGSLTSLVGLEVLNGTIYATDVLENGPYSFGTIDPTTGVFTALNDQGGSANWHGLAANVAANLLYSVDLNNSNSLVTVTPDGLTITVIGATGADIRGLAYDDANGILYGADYGNLYTIDTTTGVATLVGATGLDDGTPGLAFDPVTGILYLNAGFLQNLYTLDTATGAATLVGANGASYINGLAYIPDGEVPEPATMALSAAGLAALALVRRRKRSA